ncbi:MAG: 1,4-dihydroxy-6-naphthoate synthase [Bacteroidales bacterium]
MKLKLGFSTCPNDTFIFDALVHHKIDTEGLEFELLLADVEELNKTAFEHRIDITKLSYHAYAYVSDNYLLLDAGSALGYKNGPLLISKHHRHLDAIDGLSIAIPGKFTTANLLFSIAFPNALNKKEFLFSEIEEAVIENRVDAGLIIHENRFTYAQKGLIKIMDLGEFWESRTGMPIPLGGIVVNRALDREIQLKINRLLRKSIDYAFKHPESPLEFIKKYAQEMDPEVMKKHIELYVNDFTFNLGDEGKKAISVLYSEAEKIKGFPVVNRQIFV